MHDTLWITLPVETWRQLFGLARQENRNASDYLRVLIERETQKNTMKGTANSSDTPPTERSNNK